MTASRTHPEKCLSPSSDGGRTPTPPEKCPSPSSDGGRTQRPTELIKRMVKAFYRQYISKNHEFILCKHERKGAEGLDKYISTIRLVYFSRPQGIKSRYWCQGTIRPTDEALEVLNALIQFVRSVVVAGYTFNGKLSTENLYWVPTSKAVKIWGLTTGDMVKRTNQGVESDFTSLHDIISSKVFHKSKVPKELRNLLQLMKSDPLRYFNLIVHNIILLDDESKVAKYIMQHQKLVLAKLVDDEIYNKALTYIKCGECKDAKNWQNAIMYHPILLKVFGHKNNKNLPADSEGASIFGRHCCHHILKYAVEAVSDETCGDETGKHSSVAEVQECSKLLYAIQVRSKKSDEDDVNIKGSANKSLALDRSTGVQDLYVKNDKDQKVEVNEKRVIKLGLPDIFPLMQCFVPGLFSEVQQAVFEIVEHDYPQELLKLRNKNTGGA